MAKNELTRRLTALESKTKDDGQDIGFGVSGLVEAAKRRKVAPATPQPNAAGVEPLTGLSKLLAEARRS